VAGGKGGGIFLGTTTATVQGNVVQDNFAGGDGGGAYGQGVWRDNTFSDNEAAGRGGGVCAGGTLMGNVVISNTALNGGGICLEENGSALLVNNWIVDNQATSQGSGLFVTGFQPRLMHNTIARNTGGAGLYVEFSSGYTSVVVLTDTILVDHDVGISVTAGCTATLEATLWGNNIDWAGGGTIVTGTVNVWGDADFLDPEAGDYHIGAGSAALDVGVDAGVATDIDGDPRPLGAGYDLGADEASWEPIWRIYLPVLVRGGGA
jgi:predicted outer membrane repeat protein